ncbi:hypothetical protein [Inediibacterium massiliense]|uniref:hypothetical protein n=1 Tax=Inediibacterium massiliense TaxID=1658111 RepID=UPI0006B533A0|nr:hypothetical protein [Inediibacterium massiliense]
MLKLLKYEWMSRWKFFLGGIIIAIALNIDLIRSILKEQTPSKFAIIAMIGIFIMGLGLFFDHIRRMYKSLFGEERYLLFTSPCSGYHILGSKIIGITLESVGIFVFAILMMIIDQEIAVYKYPHLMENWKSFYTEGIKEIFTLFMILLVGYITFMLIIYLSITLSKSVFSVFKHGKILSFVCFLVVSKIVGKVVGYFDQFMDMNTLSYGMKYFHFEGTMNYFIFNSCIIGILFMLTGYLLDRKINL